ncbi:MAG: phosphatase PAP2 family protein [Ruminococcaceae bacterium]|nr:phosphatase PAP2 family protein [Oscillospiraceae bacterium]
MMRKNGKIQLLTGIGLLAAFAVFTLLLPVCNVRPVGQNGTEIGFAACNLRFHCWTGVHMTWYHMTDWLGLIPLLVCMGFGGLGLVQWVQRRKLWLVDRDILLLGVYYIVVIACYLLFEEVAVNYRPILIDGRMEASYPSSTTLLVLCVMPTLVFCGNRRWKRSVLRHSIKILTRIFCAGMVLGRLFSGVHWLTDIIGAVLFSAGMFLSYRGTVLLCCQDADK